MARRKTVTISRKPTPGGTDLPPLASLDEPAAALSAAAVPEAGAVTPPLLERAVYGTAFYLSYGVVFSVVLLGQFLPGGRTFARGLQDGSDAALRRIAPAGERQPGTVDWAA